MKYKEKYRKAEKIWKQRYETLQEKYLDLRKKAQPYLDAMEFAAETVRAFLDAVLSRGKETQEHKLSAHRRWYDKDLLWRDCLLNKYYEEAKYNAAFDRCVDVMSRMLQKYGHQVLDKLEQDAPKTEEYSKDDTETQPLADKVA